MVTLIIDSCCDFVKTSEQTPRGGLNCLLFGQLLNLFFGQVTCPSFAMPAPPGPLTSYETQYPCPMPHGHRNPLSMEILLILTPLFLWNCGDFGPDTIPLFVKNMEKILLIKYIRAIPPTWRVKTKKHPLFVKSMDHAPFKKTPHFIIISASSMGTEFHMKWGGRAAPFKASFIYKTGVPPQELLVFSPGGGVHSSIQR